MQKMKIELVTAGFLNPNATGVVNLLEVADKKLLSFQNILIVKFAESLKLLQILKCT